jgi:hypothetical protein
VAAEARHPGSSLSEEQVNFLIGSGEFTREELSDIQARIARGELAERERRTRLQSTLESLSLDEVADHLGLSTTEVRGRQGANALFAFAAGAELRFPEWQFTGDPGRPVLPNLTRLIDAFRHDMHPASILGFMTTPQTSARMDGVAMTPVDWLLNGGDSLVLEEILGSFLQS